MWCFSSESLCNGGMEQTFWTLGKDREIAVYSKAGEMWNWRTSEKGVFTLRKNWTASYAVIYSVILIVLLLLLTGVKRGAGRKKEACKCKYCCLWPGWLRSVAVSYLNQF